MCLVGSQKLAYSPSALVAAFRAGQFSFLSAKLAPVWPKSASDRAKAGRSPPGVELGHTGPTGGNQGACVVLWDGWLRRVPPVPEGTQNSARGILERFAALAGYFSRVQGGNVQGCTLELLHNM